MYIGKVIVDSFFTLSMNLLFFSLISVPNASYYLAFHDIVMPFFLG